MDRDEIQVELVYAASEMDVFRQVLKVPNESTIAFVLQHSNFPNKYPDFDFSQLSVGIYSKKKMLSDKVKESDRIEIYQPIRADAKQLRRLRKG